MVSSSDSSSASNDPPIGASLVDLALSHSELRPPDPLPSLGSGSTSELRGRMARFSTGDVHTERRGRVDELIASIDLDLVALFAREATAAVVASAEGAAVDALEVAETVPTRALAATLGWSASAAAVPDQVVADVQAMAAAIGRGEVASAATDRGVDRLRSTAERLELDADSALSLLYQNLDATKGLVLRLLDAKSGTRRNEAPATTVRVADSEVELVAADGSRLVVEAGTEVRLDLMVGGRTYGFGPHACPGEQLAMTLANAVVASLTSER